MTNGYLPGIGGASNALAAVNPVPGSNSYTDGVTASDEAIGYQTSKGSIRLARAVSTRRPLERPTGGAPNSSGAPAESIVIGVAPSQAQRDLRRLERLFQFRRLAL